jgi:hypothetical protein
LVFSVFVLLYVYVTVPFSGFVADVSRHHLRAAHPPPVLENEPGFSVGGPRQHQPEDRRREAPLDTGF